MNDITTPNRAWLIEVVPKEGQWAVVVHYKNETRNPTVLAAHERKADAIRHARAEGRRLAEAQGNPVEARFKLRNGQIPAGTHGTATYGRDPVGTAG